MVTSPRFGGTRRVLESIALVLLGGCTTVSRPAEMIPAEFPASAGPPLEVSLTTREIPGVGRGSGPYAKFPVENLGIAVEKSLRRSGVVQVAEAKEKPPFHLEAYLMQARYVTGGTEQGVVRIHWKLARRDTGWIPWCMTTVEVEDGRYSDSLGSARATYALERAARRCIQNAIASLGDARIAEREFALADVLGLWKAGRSEELVARYLDLVLPLGHWCSQDGTDSSARAAEELLRDPTLRQVDKIASLPRCAYLERALVKDVDSYRLVYRVDPQASLTRDFFVSQLGDPDAVNGDSIVYGSVVFGFDSRNRLERVSRPLVSPSREVDGYLESIRESSSSR